LITKIYNLYFFKYVKAENLIFIKTVYFREYRNFYLNNVRFKINRKVINEAKSGSWFLQRMAGYRFGTDLCAACGVW
jgi:hypothetical protein